MPVYFHNMQDLTSDCGVAVIRSLLEYYHRYNGKVLSEVISQLDINQGLSLFDIESVLMQFGIKGCSYQIDNIFSLTFDMPMVLVVDNDGANHYLLVYGIQNNEITISNPLHSRIERITLDELNKISKGYVFIVEDVLEYTAPSASRMICCSGIRKCNIDKKLVYLTLLLCFIPLIIIFSIQYFLIYQLRSLLLWQVLTIIVFELLLIGIYIEAKIRYEAIISNETSVNQEMLAFSFLEEIDNLNSKDENIYNRLIKFWNNFNTANWQLKKNLGFLELLCASVILASTFIFSRNIALFSLGCVSCYYFHFYKEIKLRKNLNKSFFNSVGELSVFVEEAIHNKLDRCLFSTRKEVSSYLKQILSKIKACYYKQRKTTAQAVALYDGVMYFNLLMIFAYGVIAYSLGLDTNIINIFISFIIVYVVYGLGKNIVQKFLDLEKYSITGSKYQFISDVNNVINKSCSITKIALEDISVTYDQEKSHPILQGITREFENCSLTLIKGHNGVGKSTLMQVIIGVIPVSNGKVSYYDGDDILDACPKEAIQSRISVYHPNQFLNYASIKSNISYDIYKHSNTSIDNVFDLELDKVVFYNGVNLSQGERQKVLLSRTLNKKADVYIFDEPTSNLDEPSKRLFFNRIVSLKKRSIIFIVTHELFFDEIADNIINLSRG